jgi:hypothetical protein
MLPQGVIQKQLPEPLAFAMLKKTATVKKALQMLLHAVCTAV